MKRILIILGLFASVTTFAQSPRIKLNQIAKDTVKGSVLISSASDSGMVYSRDFYIAYGADTVLILYGDTLASTSGIISSVLSDGVTITGDGTSGNELKADTSVIATIKALNDSLATVSASTTPDGVTITGDGTVLDPLKVDTLLISTIKGLVDTLTNRGYLEVSQLTDTLDANTRGYLTSEVDGSISNEGSLTVGAGTASTSVISSNTSGSTDVTLTAGSNITLSEAGNNITIAASGGGTTYNNISETFDTVFIDKYLNVDTSTLYVDASNNRVGIGTSSPNKNLTVVGQTRVSNSSPSYSDYPESDLLLLSGGSSGRYGISIGNHLEGGGTKAYFHYDRDSSYTVFGSGSQPGFSNPVFLLNSYVSGTEYDFMRVLADGEIQFKVSGSEKLVVKPNGNVGIGTSSPGERLVVDGGVNSVAIRVKNNYPATSIRFENTDNSLGFLDYNAKKWQIYANSGSTPTLTVDGAYSPGYVGIGATSPAEKLHVVGNIVATGSITASYSDYNLKTNISDLTDGLDLILDLKPKTFNFISDNNLGLEDDLIVGLIAQDVEQSLSAKPYLNSIIKQIGEYKAIDIHKIIPITVKAIQEQQAIIETQATEIDQLKTLITDLTNRLIILENK